MNGFQTPTIEYFTLSPILIVLGVAVLGVLVEAFLPRGRRYVVQVVLAVAGLVAAFVTALIVFDRLDPGSDIPKRGKVAAMGALAVDGPLLVIFTSAVAGVTAVRSNEVALYACVT